MLASVVLRFNSAELQTSLLHRTFGFFVFVVVVVFLFLWSFEPPLSLILTPTCCLDLRDCPALDFLCPLRSRLMPPLELRDERFHRLDKSVLKRWGDEGLPPQPFTLLLSIQEMM